MAWDSDNANTLNSIDDSLKVLKDQSDTIIELLTKISKALEQTFPVRFGGPIKAVNESVRIVKMLPPIDSHENKVEILKKLYEDGDITRGEFKSYLNALFGGK